ncbi:hypothetical protein CVT24_009704 [Panaeolus cyanescens]|uniref:Letm1 RBD domain-containing protein n=1 Tax=Panaeolus cyanescens TaxID=181874 RepID=A0A409Y9W7_9AGAR|nr:hypothetical protein CVT24_009704 [Panaeolus cyanescens]
MLRTLPTRRLLTHTSIRLYSIPSTTQAHHNAPPPPHLPPTKKPKLDLRPAPVKPTKPTTPLPSASPILKQQQKSTPASSSKSSTTGLAEAKQQTINDISDAESHGILKPPPEGADWFRRKFYFRGVKLIWSRRGDIAIINARVKAGGAPLTRAEWRLIQTQKDDINKVIPFLIIALLLEEVIPLIAIYAPFMLPSTCILPSQLERIEAKRAEKTLAFKTQYKHVYAALRRAENPRGFIPLANLSLSGAPTAVCGLLGLSTLGPDFMRIRRIKHRLEFLLKDDSLLLADPAAPMSHRELKQALEERAISASTQPLSNSDLRARLSWWLDAVASDTDSVSQDDAMARRLALVLSKHA